MATGLVIAVIVCLCLFACLGRVGGGESSIVLSGVLLALWGTIQLPLWISRLFFGWRLCWPREETLEQGGNETQFGIRQLLAWTALVAITLGIGRWLVSSDLGNQWRNPWEAIAVFGVLTVFNALLPMPIVWGSFVRHRMPIWMSVAAACCVGLTMAEIIVFKAAIGRAGGDEDIFWIMNTIQFSAASVGLLIFRACGYRLTQSSGRFKH